MPSCAFRSSRHASCTAGRLYGTARPTANGQRPTANGQRLTKRIVGTVGTVAPAALRQYALRIARADTAAKTLPSCRARQRRRAPSAAARRGSARRRPTYQHVVSDNVGCGCLRQQWTAVVDAYSGDGTIVALPTATAAECRAAAHKCARFYVTGLHCQIVKACGSTLLSYSQLSTAMCPREQCRMRNREGLTREPE